MAWHLKIFRDEKGVTTAGMAVSIMLSLALIFSGAQLYRTTSASAEIQEVADVAALAAENEVAEFIIAVKVCDAICLSMTLLAATVYGIGIACACVPALEALSAELISLANRITDACNRFYDAAVNGLNALQRMLPFFSAAAAASVASANNAGAMDASYYALAVLVPQEGVQIGSVSVQGLSDLKGKVEADAQEIRDKSAQVEQLAQQANEAKLKGWRYDCGNAVTGAEGGKCMYERAGHLAGLSASRNPLYSSPDAWSFDVALERSKAYYTARDNQLPPVLSQGAKAETNFQCRHYYYQYALTELGGVSRQSVEGETVCTLPYLYRNTSELKSSWLYNSIWIHVSADGTPHAFRQCPGISGYAGEVKLDHFDRVEGVPVCPACEFTLSSLGEVGNAPSRVPTGFEYHYTKVREASEEYERAVREAAPLKAQIKGKVTPIMDAVGGVMAEAVGKRISAQPPGRGGVIVMLVNTAQNSAATGFESTFVGGDSVLGTRAAVSAAALVEDGAHDSGNVITSLLNGFGQSGGAAVGAARIALDCWSSLLTAYENGQSAILGAVENGFNSLSMGSEGGLGAWASDALRSSISSVGLAPANLHALKPALLNTQHVAASDSGSFAVKFKQVKANALSLSSSSPDVFTGAASNVAASVTEAISGASITIAELEFPVGGITIPITLTVPPSVSEAAGGFVSQCVSAVSGAVGAVTGVKSWQ